MSNVPTSKPRSLKRLESLARKGSRFVNVEDLLNLMTDCSTEHAATIEKIASDGGWKTSEDAKRQVAAGEARDVPLATWAKYVSGGLRSGSGWLAAEAIRDHTNSDFAVAVLGSIAHPETYAFLAEIIEAALKGKQIREGVLLVAIGQVNELGMKRSPPGPKHGPVQIPTEIEPRLREMLHVVVKGKASPTVRAYAMYALRWCGDATTEAILSSVPKLDEPWKGTEKACIRALRKRFRSTL